MVTFARFLMRLGLFVTLAAFVVWIASLFGFFIETARWVPHAVGGGLLLLVIGCQIFFRRTSGVRDLPPGHSHEQIKHHR
jgi:hypothetical protein